MFCVARIVVIGPGLGRRDSIVGGVAEQFWLRVPNLSSKHVRRVSGGDEESCIVREIPLDWRVGRPQCPELIEDLN